MWSSGLMNSTVVWEAGLEAINVHNFFSLFFCFKLVALKSLGPALIKTQQFGFFGFFSLIISS